MTGDGGANVFSRGVCWNTAGSPTIADPHSIDGGGTGLFDSALTGLLPDTTYHVRAYASNSTGTAYGNEVTFTTFRWVVTFLADAGGSLSGQNAAVGPRRRQLHASRGAGPAGCFSAGGRAATAPARRPIR